MAKGFFDLSEIEVPVGKAKKLVSEDRSGKAMCQACGLFKKCNHPRMKVGGKGKKGYLVIAEAPGEDEDDAGEQLVGKVGKWLEWSMRKVGDVKLHEDCYKINSVNCRPSASNRTPTAHEISCCRPMVMQAIKELSPKVILSFGAPAFDSLYGHRLEGRIARSRDENDESGFQKIGRWRGWKIPDPLFQAWVTPMWHPSFVVRNGDNSHVNTIFKRDLSEALDRINVPFPKIPTVQEELSKVEILSPREAIRQMDKFLKRKPPLLFLDYETTGIKPYEPGHKIWCASLAPSGKKSFSFLVKDDKKIKMKLAELLTSPSIGIGAQFAKFEILWTKAILGVWIARLAFDTWAASRVLDNRPGISGLKFQNFVQFGILGYESEVDSFLKSAPGSSLNRIHEAPTEALLRYCGVDSMTEFRLAEIQMKQL